MFYALDMSTLLAAGILFSQNLPPLPHLLPPHWQHHQHPAQPQHSHHPL